MLVQDVLRIHRQRQQTDQHFAGGQKGIQLRGTGKAAHAVHPLGLSAPGVDREIEAAQGLRHPRTQHAQAHHAHREVAMHRRKLLAPAPGAGIGLVPVQPAKVPQHRVAHVLGHLHRHARVFQAHHLRLWRDVQAHQRIHARAQVEHGLQARLFVKKRLRRGPGDGVIRRGTAGAPQGHLGLGPDGVQAVDPELRRAIGVVQSDPHPGFLMFQICRILCLLPYRQTPRMSICYFNWRQR